MIYTPTQRYELSRSRRILKADAYASALRMRVCARTEDFVLHFMAHTTKTRSVSILDETYRPGASSPISSPTQAWAQLGLVVPKRLAKHAVRRNTLKRLIRESFRLRAADLPDGLWVVRLHTKVNAVSLSASQKRAWADQLVTLWGSGLEFSLRLRTGVKP